MPNINVRKKLENVSNQLDQIIEHVIQYSGIPSKDAQFIDNVSTQICEASARLAALARDAQGDRSATRLVTDVRRTLGFTSP